MRMIHSKLLIVGFLVFAAIPAVLQPLGAQDRVGQAVVRITSYRQGPDWANPWRMNPTDTGHGSGFLIGNNWILTNAHVVSDSRLLLVNKLTSPEPFIAEVAGIAHDSDLALLRVKNERFYHDMAPLEFGGIPELRSRVQAYGYPLGGQELARTEGVISRIEFGTYIHPGVDSHLLVQTDSAINPGNSGGPVVQDGRAVGVAFQSNLRLNDVGYFIPVPLIKRFIRDFETGSYAGVPEIGIQTSSLLNRHQREYLGLSGDVGGVLIDRVIPHSSVDGILEEGDVLVRIAGKPIDRAGMVQFGEHRVAFFIEAEHLQIGESLEMRVWREKRYVDVTVVLKPPPFSRELRNSYDFLPEYLIFGGLVFIALNRDYMQSTGKRSPALAYEHWFREVEQPHTRRPQVVLVSRVLPSPVNSGYTGLRNFVVHEVNGTPVRSLAHLDYLLNALADSTMNVVFTSEWEPMPVVLNLLDARKQHDAILLAYGVPSARRIHPSSASPVNRNAD